MNESTRPMISAAEVFSDEPPVEDYHFLDNIVRLRKTRGKNAVSVLKDVVRISWSKKRMIDPALYFKYGLYDLMENDAEAGIRYLYPNEIHKINHQINFGIFGDSAVQDKFHLEAILSHFGFPTVRTQAVLIATQSSASRYVTSTEQAIDFLANRAEYPLFGKPISSSLSVGVTSLIGYDPGRDAVEVEDKGLVPATELVEHILKAYGELGYLLQSRVSSHPAVAPFSGGALGCVRITTLRQGGDAMPLYAVWKIPSAGSIADNFWRSDNRLALIDLDSGVIKRVRSGTGLSTKVDQEADDEETQLSGFELPNWDATVALARDISSLFRSTPLIGWDIGIGENGPVVVEANGNPDHGLYQLAAGAGVRGTPAGDSLQAALRAARTKQREMKKRLKSKAYSTRRARRSAMISQGFHIKGDQK